MEIPNPKIRVIFDKRRVEHCDLATLLEAFNPSAMSHQSLREYCGSVEFVFRGYEKDGRLPFLIPELRKFMRQLRRAWPHGAFFAGLSNSFLALEAFGQLENAAIIERENSNEFWVGIRSLELRRYIRQCRRTVDAIGRRCGMRRRDIDRRISDVDNYLKIRFGPTRQS